jgi:hypothetical protein
MIYVISIPILLILVLLTWVVTNLVRSRDPSRPSSATRAPHPPPRESAQETRR